MTLREIPVVSIVGRPNVGKSTLFNRLVGRRVAIVDDRPGVTRDSNIAKCRIEGKLCHLVDTGGLSNTRRKDEIESGVDRQILASIENSSLVLFVVDLAAGPQPEDKYVAETLRRRKTEVVFVANKADGDRLERQTGAFFELGLGEPMPVSALHGRNVEELLERVGSLLPAAAEAPPEERIRFCIVGRPNVGKSSITNAILGQERCVVSSVPGTTRDSIETDFTWNELHFTIIDTAGQRRNKSSLDNIEFYSITRARAAIRNCDVAALVLDATQGLLEGDKRIAAAIQEYQRGFLIIVNKMDLVENPVMEYFIKNLVDGAPFLRHTPIMFVSAHEREGMDAVLDSVADIHDRLHTALPKELVENLIYDIRALFSPRSRGAAIGEIKGVIHDKTNPPRIVVRTNDKTLFPPEYVRLIENRIREAFDLDGVPLEIVFTGSPKKKGKK